VPNIKSAIKRVEVAERNRQRNVAYKSTVKTVTKKFLTRMGEYNAKPSEEVLTEVKTLLNDTFSKIDKAVSSGVIHANTAARKKSRLAAALKKVQTKAV
jgi:small subunit ribosomal protein S20